MKSRFHNLLSILLPLALAGLYSTETLAARHVKIDEPAGTISTTLSNKEAQDLAKYYLADFLAVDPEITLNDLKRYILALNTTSTDQIDAMMQAYLLSLMSAPEPVNQPPQIEGSPMASVAEGSAYFFAPSASDADGDSLSFSITNKPAWANFNPQNGTLSGTPGYDNAGVYDAITISVSDGSETNSLVPFSVTVLNTNRAPVISGAPTTAIEAGSAYEFTPTAYDPDGDKLSFSATNLPGWASFDNASGTLSGIPDNADAASYADITILVSDGLTTATLAPFSLQVVAAAALEFSTTLSWVAPSTRTDGAVLNMNEIDGYRIYMGDNEGTLTPVMDINDSSVMSFTLNNLTAGGHYFAVTAYDLDGNESGRSNIIYRSDS